MKSVCYPNSPKGGSKSEFVVYKQISYISIIDEASDFKFGLQLRFAKAHHEIPLEEIVGIAMGEGSSPNFGVSPLLFLQRLKLAISNLIHSLSLPRPIIKLHPEEKVGMALG